MDSTNKTKPRLAGRGFANVNAFSKALTAYSIATVGAIIALPVLPAIWAMASKVLQSLIGGLQ